MIPRILFLSLLLCAGAAAAQEPAAAGLEIELNALEPSQKGCKFTFLASNGLKEDGTRISFEFVIFNGKGTVERLALLDFRDLPAGKSRVRQFDVPGIACDDVKSLLVNDAPVCEGIGKGRCMDGLVTRSKAGAGLEG